MVARRFRLRHRSDFRRVRQEGRVWQGPLLRLSALPNGLNVTRHGIVAGRRLGNAVVRNRIKRRLREAIREVVPSLRAGWDLVWLPRRNCSGVPFEELQRAVSDILRRADLLQDVEVSDHEVAGP